MNGARQLQAAACGEGSQAPPDGIFFDRQQGSLLKLLPGAPLCCVSRAPPPPAEGRQLPGLAPPPFLHLTQKYNLGVGFDAWLHLAPLIVFRQRRASLWNPRRSLSISFVFGFLEAELFPTPADSLLATFFFFFALLSLRGGGGGLSVCIDRREPERKKNGAGGGARRRRLCVSPSRCRDQLPSRTFSD